MMPQTIPAGVIGKSDESEPGPPVSPQPAAETLRARARELADELVWLPNVRSSRTFANRCRMLAPKARTGAA